MADQPYQWYQYLSLSEWNYNTLWHSSITPFEASYSSALPSLLDYVEGTTSFASVDQLLSNRIDIMTTSKKTCCLPKQESVTKLTLVALMCPSMSTIGHYCSCNLSGKQRFPTTVLPTNSHGDSMDPSKLLKRLVWLLIDFIFLWNPSFTMSSMFPSWSSTKVNHHYYQYLFQLFFSMNTQYLFRREY